MKSFLLRIRALVVGAFLASLIVGLLGGSAHSPMELMIPVMIGNAMAAVGLLVLLSLLGLTKLGSRLPGDTQFCWIAFPVCLAPSVVGPFAPIWVTFAFAVLVLVLSLPLAGRISGLGWIPSALILIAMPIYTVWGALHNHEILRAENRNRSAPKLPALESPFQEGLDVILVSIDTLRADAIVGPREPAYELPFFDGMRAAGRWWDYGYSPSNETLPGHVSMLSGQNALTNRVRFNLDPVPPEQEMGMVQEYFQKVGYHTVGVISNGVISGDIGFARGFHVYDDSTVRHYGAQYECIAYMEPRTWFGLLLTDRSSHGLLSRLTFHALTRPPERLIGRSQKERAAVTNEQAMDLFDQLYEHERPFFFFLHYMDPHHPYGAPEGFAGRIVGDRFDDIPAGLRGNESSQGMIDMDQIQPVLDAFASDDPKRHEQGQRGADYFHAIYRENVLFLDSQLELIRKRVEASGRPTLWLITADHGEQFGEHRTMMHSEEMYKDSLRVPFILVGPDIQPEHASGIPMLSDVAPTLLTATDVLFPDDMTGHSLVGGYGEPSPYQIASEDEKVMLREGFLKVIAIRVGDDFEPIAFFDLEADPMETENILGQHPKQEDIMEILRIQMKKDKYVVSELEISAARAAALSEIGYGDDVAEHVH